MTVVEAKLWEALRGLRLNIRRQAPMGRYVADFIHHRSRLVIEVDSPWHDSPDAQLRDLDRDAWFRSQCYEVLRLRDRAVFKALDVAVEQIAIAIANHQARSTGAS